MEANMNNSIGQLRVDFHEFCNFIPIVSTFTNTIAVVQKHLYVPDLERIGRIDSDRYYSYLKAKDFGEEWMLFIPFANVIFCVLRCCNIAPGTDTTVAENLLAVSDNKSSNSVSFYLEKINELENKLNEQLLGMLNEITSETSEEEKTVAAKEVSSLLIKSLEFFKNCPDDVSLTMGEMNDLGIGSRKSIISSVINLSENFSKDQLAVLMRGFKKCDHACFYKWGHWYFSMLKRDINDYLLTPLRDIALENDLFREIIKLYDFNPDLAKLLLQEVVRAYSTGTTDDNKALDRFVELIITKEQAIDYLEACQDLPDSIKKDNYLKLALFTQNYEERYPAVFAEKGIYMKFSDREFSQQHKPFHFDEKDAIIAAFEEMEIDYVSLLPKNNWLMQNMNQDIANIIFSNLPIEPIVNMSMTCKMKSEEYSIPGYVHKHLVGDMFRSLQRLFKLYNRLTQSKESSQQKAHFLKELNELIKDLKLKPKVLLDDKELLPLTKLELKGNNRYDIISASQGNLCSYEEILVYDTFNNHLSRFIKNELFSKFTFSSESDGILLRNGLDLLFQVGTDGQLEDFITTLLLPSDINQLDLREKCFYSQLTDERIERLASIVQEKGAKFGCIILQNVFKCAIDVYADKQNNKVWSNEDIQMLELAEKLTIAFYNVMPDLTRWEEPIKSLKSDDKIKRKECIFDFHLIGKGFVQFFALAETLAFLNKSIKQEEQTGVEENTIRHNFLKRLYSSQVNFWNNFLPKRYIERTFFHICAAQEDFAIKEKKLVNFVRSVLIKDRSIDPHRWYDHLFNVCSKINLEDPELTVEIQKIIYSTMVDLFHVGSYIQSLTECINTEQQFHIFHKILLKLPEPSRTIQLTILRDHISSKKIVELDEVFNDDILISNLNLEWGMADTLNEVQKFVDKTRSLENLDQLAALLKDNRKDHCKLQALAQGIKMPDGSLLKCPLEPKMIEDAFLNERLYYQGYEEPIELKSFIDSYHESTK